MHSQLGYHVFFFVIIIIIIIIIIIVVVVVVVVVVVFLLLLLLLLVVRIIINNDCHHYYHYHSIRYKMKQFVKQSIIATKTKNTNSVNLSVCTLFIPHFAHRLRFVDHFIEDDYE